MREMSHRGITLLAAAVALALAGCSNGGGGGVQVERKSPTLAVVSGTTPSGTGEPLPTPTPVAPPEVLLSTTEVYQAGAILVSVVGEISGGKVTFLAKTHTLLQGAQSMYTFVGVGIEAPPGLAAIKVDFAMKNGSNGSITDEVTIIGTQWTVDSLTFTESQTQTFLDPKTVAAENDLLADTYAADSMLKLWNGPWQAPVDGPITARFGEQRSINGSAPSGHHTGTDFGAEEGTPVVAANRGRVVMARQLSLRGNMVIIDHGGGVLSGYGHLSSFAVAEGQTVEAGEVVGYVGNTGLSTGAHLHWEMSIDGVLVDAYRFIDGSDGI